LVAGSRRGSARIVILAAFFAGVFGLAAVVAVYLVAGHHGSAGAAGLPTKSARPRPSPPPLTVVSVWPARAAVDVPYASTIKIRFSAPVAATTPDPRLSPSVAGTWRVVDPYVLEFQPTAHLPVYQTVHLIIPGGSAGVHGRGGERLARRFATSFTVGGPTSVTRLQQLLAELGYLPVTFVPSALGGAAASATSAASALATASAQEPADPASIPLDPVAGSFHWRYRHIPASLAALWVRGKYTTMLKGAVMAFESEHGLVADGIAGRDVWLELLRAVANRQVTRRPYNYVEVSTSVPETLRVWSGGKIVYRCLANTGIPSRPTATGTYPVYERFVSTTMSGTNPDGSHYSDPGVPYVSYFNGGDAVHGFLRSQYGYPQSLGCVELTYSDAAIVFRYDTIGTLVTVS
jgi:peptidoglycan hydrolase-like protein with peptidoglycan-binding domain